MGITRKAVTASKFASTIRVNASAKRDAAFGNDRVQNRAYVEGAVFCQVARVGNSRVAGDTRDSDKVRRIGIVRKERQGNKIRFFFAHIKQAMPGLFSGRPAQERKSFILIQEPHFKGVMSYV